MILFGIWILSGLLALYFAIKYDYDNFQDMVDEEPIEALGEFLSIFALGCLSLVMICSELFRERGENKVRYVMQKLIYLIRGKK